MYSFNVITVVGIERSVDTGKVRASPQNARVARKPDVSDWNQSEPVVIFINQYR